MTTYAATDNDSFRSFIAESINATLVIPLFERMSGYVSMRDHVRPHMLVGPVGKRKREMVAILSRKYEYLYMPLRTSLGDGITDCNTTASYSCHYSYFTQMNHLSTLLTTSRTVQN